MTLRCFRSGTTRSPHRKDGWHVTSGTELYVCNVVAVALLEPESDGVITELGPVNHLEELRLVGPLVTDTTLEKIRGLKGLRWLSVYDSNVTDAGLRHLKDMSELRVLSLGKTRIGDAGLVHLYSLANLESVFLGGTQVTDAGVNELRRRLAAQPHRKSLLAHLRRMRVGRTKPLRGGEFRLTPAHPPCPHVLALPRPPLRSRHISSPRRSIPVTHADRHFAPAS